MKNKGYETRTSDARKNPVYKNHTYRIDNPSFGHFCNCDQIKTLKVCISLTFAYPICLARY